MTDLSSLTREMLMEFYSKEQLVDLVLELARCVQQLTARVSELERHLSKPGKNSTNSSNPSSTDRGTPQKNQSQRKKSGKQPGGQPGHPGKTRMRDAEPDIIEQHRPPACSHCGTCFTGQEKTRIAERRQQIEIPPIETVTTEHRSIACTCSHCGEETRGAFPDAVPASICFGPRLRSLVSGLKEVHHFSYERLAQHLEDFCSLSLSQGTLCSLVQRVADRLSPRYQEIKEELRNAAVIESDETGTRIAGRRAQLWVFRNPFATSSTSIVPGATTSSKDSWERSTPLPSG